MAPLTAIGLRAHSGWAAAVSISGPPFPPRVVDRRRIEFAGEGVAQPFHAAEPMEFQAAEEYIARIETATRILAEAAIARLVADLSAKGHRVATCVVLAGSSRELPGLDKILKSHALIHTAEGEFFRNALRNAAKECGLKVAGFREKTLAADHPERFEVVSSLGRLIGPPWQMDHKLAALGAWLALQK